MHAIPNLFFFSWLVMHLKSRSQAQLDFGGDALACVVPSAVLCVRAARAMRCVVRAELWDLQARIWSCQDTRATCFEVENTLSGKMRLKGKRRSGEKWGGLSGKSVWAPLFFFELRVLFNVLGGAARPLADARVAGRRWVIRSPVARAAVRRVPA